MQQDHAIEIYQRAVDPTMGEEQGAQWWADVGAELDAVIAATDTRHEEITRLGGTWSPKDARITEMIWGHSAKAGQLYATPIETLVDLHGG